MKDRKKVFIVVSRGGLLGKFIETGLIQALCKKDLELVVVTPFAPTSEYTEALSGLTVSFEPLFVARLSTIRKILQEFGRAAIFNPTVRAVQMYTVASEKDPSRILFFPRRYIFPLIRFIPGIKQFLRFLNYHLDPQKQNDHLFCVHKPDLVFSTTPHDESEVAMLKAARRFSIPTLCLPKSWDNLPKTLFPVKTDHILVWGEEMKKDAIKLQGFNPSEITITGASQFDRYAHHELLLSREEFMRRFNLDPKKKIILYGSSGANLCDEGSYLDLIANFLKENENVEVLIRPHSGYQDDRKRFARFTNQPGFTIDQTITQSTTPQSVWDTNPERIGNLHNSLAHADVCVNIASTLTIDALLCGTPVVNIHFDVHSDVDLKRKGVSRIFEMSYVKTLMYHRATWEVKSKEELWGALSECLNNKNARIKQREQLIHAFAYQNDGKSTERIAAAVRSRV